MTTQTPQRPTNVVNPFEAKQMPVLLLGIVSMFFALLGPVAWSQGKKLKREAEAAGFAEPTMAKIGRILGLIATALLAIWVLLVFVALLLPIFL
jgi:hypothetical protein